MTAPVKYADLTKDVSDLLSKDFPAGELKLEAKTSTPSGVTFTTTATKASSGKAAADGKATESFDTDLKIKWDNKKYGFVATETFGANGIVKSLLEYDKLVEGLKFDLDTVCNTKDSSKNTAKFTAGYKRPHMNTSLTLSSVAAVSESVFARDNILFGVKSTADLKQMSVTDYELSVGYTEPSFSAVLSAKDNFGAFVVSLYNNVDANVKAGAIAKYVRRDNSIVLNLGGSYRLDNDASVKAKFGSDGKLGLSYSQKLRPGAKIILGAAINATKFDQGDHKVGLALVLEA